MPSSPSEQAAIRAEYDRLMGKAPPPAAAPPAAPPAAAPPPAAPAAGDAVDADALRSTTESMREARSEADEAIAEFFSTDEAPADEAPAEGAPAATETPAVPLSPIDEYLQKASKNRAPLQDASSRAERMIADAQAEANRIREEARAAARTEMQQLFGLMQTNPLAAAERLQTPVTDVMRTAAEANDPMYAFKQQMLGELAKRDAVIEKLMAGESKRTEEQRAAEARAQAEAQRKSQEDFVREATEDKYPALAILWGPRRILAEAYEEGRAIHAAAEAAGERPSFSNEQLLAHLEAKAMAEFLAKADKVSSLTAKVKGKAPPAAAPPPAAKRPPAKTVVPGSTVPSNPQPRGVVRTVEPPVSAAKMSDREQQKAIARMLDGMKAKGRKSA